MRNKTVRAIGLRRLSSVQFNSIVIGFMFCILILPKHSLAQFQDPVIGDRLMPATTLSSIVHNTGTDSYVTDNLQGDAEHVGPCVDNVRRWVVNVADGSIPTFSWSFRRTSACSPMTWSEGSFDLDVLGYDQVCDPDVAMSLDGNGDLWAMVVGISKNASPGYGRIQVSTFKWNWSSASTGEFLKDSCASSRTYLCITWPASPSLPSEESGVTKGRKCLSPNVDANSTGQVSIVWSELENIQVVVTWGWPFDFSQKVNVKKGNVYTLNGWINGTNVAGDTCICYNGCTLPFVPSREYLENPDINTPLFTNGFWNRFFSYSNRCGGIPIGSPRDISSLDKLIYFSSPDVCVSEPYNDSDTLRTFVTYSFYKSGFNPDPGDAPDPVGLVVTQHEWSKCYLANAEPEGDAFYYPEQLSAGPNYWRRTGFGGVIGGVPRIAAPPAASATNYKDWTLTMGNAGGYCDHETGDVIISPVRVWGRRDGYVTDDGVDINAPSDEQGYINVQAVVAYWNGSPSSADRFNVAWTANEVRSTGTGVSGDRNDVLVKAYELVVNSSGVGSLTGFSASSPYPAYNNDYSIVNSGKGNQQFPSIAGRRFGSFSNFVFSNFKDDTDYDVKWKIACNSTVSLPLDFTCGNVIIPPLRKATGGGIEIIPNPSEGSFTIKLKLQEGETWSSYRVVDAGGKTVSQRQSAGKESNTILEQIPNAQARGLYILKMVTNKGSRTEKILLK